MMKKSTKEISFPLGGIGTGCIGLSGSGRLIDWEIFNRPNKRSFNGFSHFAVKAEAEGNLLDARVLNGDLQPSYLGQPVRGGPYHSGFGFGPESCTMAGMPHFKETEFTGEFPIASMKFSDENFPGMVEMTAFNPFLPLNDLDSSIPGAFFSIAVKNNTQKDIAYTVCLSSSNPVPVQKVENRFSSQDGTSLIKLSSEQFCCEDPLYGDIAIATDAKEVSCQEFWYRGGWCDNLEMFWRDFTKGGRLQNRNYKISDAPSSRHKDMASLAAHFTLPGGESKTVRFLIAWSFPNAYNYWNPEQCSPIAEGDAGRPKAQWKNYYATVFKDSEESARYCLANWERLYSGTLEFKTALFSSTLPPEVIDAVSANLSVLKSPTCLRLEDGSFYAFEGCLEDSGCCEGSCTHVWNYAYALPFLFPKLERSMRDLDFNYNQREDGRMSFRLQLPLGREPANFRACADGQFGGVIKAYRDWKISGDSQWLKSNWKAIKKSIEYAWAGSNEDKWDADRDGVLEGRQHHTLDMELFGPNSWLNGFYLAALKAGAEMAEYLGESDTANEYTHLFQRGKRWTDANLFNGEYYCQKVDLKSKTLLEKYDTGLSLFGEDTAVTYWNEEEEEIKYQIGGGCAIDQVIAQWHANLCGLGEIFDTVRTKKALEALYKYNFKRKMRDVANPWRLFSLNDEAGLVICTWPAGVQKPAVPLTYSSETMTGFEYQAAAHMIQAGLINEGLEITKAIRDRYDGEKRNPWNEMECGSNYARAMASYSLLLALSGFEYDMVRGHIGFDPKIHAEDFYCFWCLGTAWGGIRLQKAATLFTVKYGNLSIGSFSSGSLNGRTVTGISLDGLTVDYTQADKTVHFKKEILLQAGSQLHIETADQS